VNTSLVEPRIEKNPEKERRASIKKKKKIGIPVAYKIMGQGVRQDS